MNKPRGSSLRLVNKDDHDDDDDDAPVEGVDASGFVASGQSEHALLAAGKISVEEFMDMSVDRALSHLVGQISEDRLSLMREVLRAQLEQDPHLSALRDRVASGD